MHRPAGCSPHVRAARMSMYLIASLQLLPGSAVPFKV